MKVLIACEFSGIVRDAFIKKGHDAISCDLLPTERPGPHYQGDVFDIINNGFDMIIAFPPCTYLSNAGVRHLYPKGVLNIERYEKGMLAKKFFMDIYTAHCSKIAVENPIHTKIFKMPLHTQQIQPYEFGHPVSKKTRLWLKGLPLLRPTKIVEKTGTFLPSGTGRKLGKKTFGTCPTGKGKDRSITFTGIADAMADQWG